MAAAVPYGECSPKGDDRPWGNLGRAAGGLFCACAFRLPTWALSPAFQVLHEASPAASRPFVPWSPGPGELGAKRVHSQGLAGRSEPSGAGSEGAGGAASVGQKARALSRRPSLGTSGGWFLMLRERGSEGRAPDLQASWRALPAALLCLKKVLCEGERFVRPNASKICSQKFC